MAIADGVSKSKMRYKKYIKPEVSPLEGGVILMTSNVGDTTELGREIYIYLKKKCEESSDSKYTLSDSEGLTVQDKPAMRPTIINYDINYVEWSVYGLHLMNKAGGDGMFGPEADMVLTFKIFEDGRVILT